MESQNNPKMGAADEETSATQNQQNSQTQGESTSADAAAQPKVSAIDKIRQRLQQQGKPKVTIDMSLGDEGAVEADAEYIAKVIAARYIHSEEHTPKFNVSFEVFEGEDRIGVITDSLYTSVPALPRLRNFLLSCNLEEDAKTSSLDPYALSKKLIGKACGIVTCEKMVNDEKRVFISEYLLQEEVTEGVKV